MTRTIGKVGSALALATIMASCEPNSGTSLQDHGANSPGYELAYVQGYVPGGMAALHDFDQDKIVDAVAPGDKPYAFTHAAPEHTAEAQSWTGNNLQRLTNLDRENLSMLAQASARSANTIRAEDM